MVARVFWLVSSISVWLIECVRLQRSYGWFLVLLYGCQGVLGSCLCCYVVTRVIWVLCCYQGVAVGGSW